VEKSLVTAAALKPDSWTLIVPINHNESELKWFDGLRRQYDFPLAWLGKDWLDEQMAAFPDIRRYYLEGAADEVVRLLAEISREDAALTGGVGQAVDRLKAIQARLHDIDPQYRIEVSPGPAAAAMLAFPDAVLYVEETTAGGESWTVSVLAKYRDAPRDRPIQVKANLVFEGWSGSEEERSKYLDLMRFGSDETVVVRRADNLTLDAPAGLSTVHPTGVLKISSVPEEIDLSATLNVSQPGGAPIGALHFRLTNRSRGTEGVTLTGAHETGLITVRLRARDDLSSSMSLTVQPMAEYSPAEVLPLLRTLSAMAAPNLVAISVAGKPLAPPSVLTATSPISAEFVRLVEGIAKMQAGTGTHFRVKGDPTAEDVTTLNKVLRLLDGGELPVKPLETLDFFWNGQETPSVGCEFSVVALQFWHVETFMQESIQLGPCVALSGPYVVARVSSDGDRAIALSRTADTQAALRRGQIGGEPVLPGAGVRVFIPDPSSTTLLERSKGS